MTINPIAWASKYSMNQLSEGLVFNTSVCPYTQKHRAGESPMGLFSQGQIVTLFSEILGSDCPLVCLEIELAALIKGLKNDRGQ